LITRRADDVTAAIFLTHHPNPFRDLLRSSQVYRNTIGKEGKEGEEELGEMEDLLDPSEIAFLRTQVHISLRKEESPTFPVKSPVGISRWWNGGSKRDAGGEMGDEEIAKTYHNAVEEEASKEVRRSKIRSYTRLQGYATVTQRNNAPVLTTRSTPLPFFLPSPSSHP